MKNRTDRKLVARSFFRACLSRNIDTLSSLVPRTAEEFNVGRTSDRWRIFFIFTRNNWRMKVTQRLETEADFPVRRVPGQFAPFPSLSSFPYFLTVWIEKYSVEKRGKGDRLETILLAAEHLAGGFFKKINFHGGWCLVSTMARATKDVSPGFG